MTVTGSDFLASSVVHWNSSSLTTTFVNSTTITAQVPASDLLVSGANQVSVVNPAPGGGSSNTVSFTVETSSVAPLALTSINPSSAIAGSATINITLTGSGFTGQSEVMWNTTSLTSTFNSSTSITAQVPSSLLQTIGTAQVTVINPNPGGETSGSQTFTITAPPGQTTVNVQANSLAWDPVNQQIYLSLPSVDGANGNTVQILNPMTGDLGATVFAGSEPNLLAVSSSSQYLYVGLNGASTVQRFVLPTLTPDISIALGNDSFYGPYFASDLQAAPGSDGTVAVVRSTPGVSPSEEGGVVIYDNGVARPQVLCGFIQSGCTGSGGELFNSIQWNGNATEMYAANNEDTGFDFYTIPVTAAGFGTVTDYGGLVAGFGESIHFDPVTQYVYGDNGTVINPTTGTQVGTFAASGLMVPDGTLNTAFFLGQFSTDGSNTYSIESFDLQKFTPIATVAIPNVVGTPTHFIRWGTAGLAFNTSIGPAGSSGESGQVYLVSGSFVNPASAVTNLQSKPKANVQRTWKTPNILKKTLNPTQEIVR